ncbi:MAG: hypothetical protein JNL61_13200 [Rhizobiaceae bacterium]|nr:hypothetical protein [Rhizobiaceae bacterium]
MYDCDVIVTARGRACKATKNINVSTMLTGLGEVGEGGWIVIFMHYDLGWMGVEQGTLQSSVANDFVGNHPHP